MSDTFDSWWAAAPVPGEYDSYDECDQSRWRDLVRLAYDTRPAAVPVEALQKLYDRIMTDKPNAEVGMVILLSRIQNLIDQAERREKQA